MEAGGFVVFVVSEWLQHPVLLLKQEVASE